MGIHVLGTGSYTPAFQVTNEDMAKIVETNDEWIRTRTGIGTRHISDGEPTWYMAHRLPSVPSRRQALIRWRSVC